MRFSYLVQLIVEDSSFANLPKSAPYGYWIYPNGDFFVVHGVYCHDEYGERLVENSELYKEQYEEWKEAGERAAEERGEEAWMFDSSASSFLWNHRFIRVVYDRVLETLFWESHKKSITPTQLKTIKDLALFYNIPNVKYGN